MSELDLEKWEAAERATEWRQSQVQGFLYGEDSKDGKGRHVVRDCFLPFGEQNLWQETDLTGERYDELSAEASRQIRIRQIEIIQNQYTTNQGR